MYFFRQHKVLYSFVFFVVSLVIYCFGFYFVQAAEISTLPADIDITVSYDADNINWTYDGKDYSFDRNTRIGYYYGDDFYYSSNGYAGVSSLNPDTTGISYNYTVEKSSSFFRDASYWFSPSENALYIIRAYDYNSSVYGLVRSFASGVYGTFGFSDRRSLTSRYDFNDNSFVFGGLDDRYKYTSADSFYYYNPSAGFRLDNNRLYFNDDTKYTCRYPADLICIYSTYEISGFYEFDTSKVVAPDYYMNYQYIFYRDGKGYIFVDSAQPLIEITAQGSYSYLTFADVCNKYVYTSPDGITWTIQTTIDTMYGGTFTRLAYDWLYDKTTVGAVNQYNAELVYTNDDNFGVGLFDWEDIKSAISDITLISTEGGTIADIIHNQGTDTSGSNGLNARDYFNAFDLFLTSGEYEKNLSSSSYDPYMYIISGLRSIYDLFSGEYRTVYYWDDDSKGIRSYNVASMYGLMLNTYYETYNIRNIFESFGNDFMSSISTLNNNLSGLYELDGKLLSAVKDIKIPDYKDVLADISAKLDKLPASGSSSTLFDDTVILGRLDTANDYLNDIKGLGTSSLLTNILNLLTGDGEGLKVTINPNFKLNIDNDLKAEFTAKIDKIFDKLFDIDATLDKIAEFNIGTGGTDKDYSSMLTLINDNLYTASGRVYDLNQPLERILQAINDIDFTVSFPESTPEPDLWYDDPDSDDDLIDFVSEYAQTALDKSYFSSFITFDDDTNSGIRFYNGLSEDTFKALGPFGAVLLVPVGFILVGAAVRRHT